MPSRHWSRSVMNTKNGGNPCRNLSQILPQRNFSTKPLTHSTRSSWTCCRDLGVTTDLHLSAFGVDRLYVEWHVSLAFLGLDDSRIGKAPEFYKLQVDQFLNKVSGASSHLFCPSDPGDLSFSR